MPSYQGLSPLEQSYKVFRTSLFPFLCDNYITNHKDLRFPHLSAMQSELDRIAADNICRKYCSLQDALTCLERQYAKHQNSSEAKHCEMLLAKIHDSLDYLTQNIDQIFCDELDQLGSGSSSGLLPGNQNIHSTSG